MIPYRILRTGVIYWTIHLDFQRRQRTLVIVKKSLHIKRVTLEYLDQYEELNSYVFQVTSRILRESGYEEGEYIRSKRPVLQETDVFGWFTEDDKLVSSVSIYPFQVNIHGTIYEMGGITGVGTYPEYTNMGLMNELLKLALNRMREAEQHVSYLYPYSIPYYRKKGWEIMSDHMTFTLKDSQLLRHKDVPGRVERMHVGATPVKDVYDQFARSMHGALIRGEFEWAEYWRWENEAERTAAVYFDSQQEPQGYLFYWIENEVFHLKEMIYLNQEARQGLWNFISAHHSMVTHLKGHIYMNEPLAFLLDDSQIVETIEPYYMARIVDVGSFLAKYPYDDAIQPFHFVVSDPVAEWNNGIFGVGVTADNEPEIRMEPIGNPVTLDIQTLSTLMMSYRSPSYLHKIGRIQTDPATLRLLEKLIPGEQPYFSDYF